MQQLVNLFGMLSIAVGGLVVAVPQNVPRQSTELVAWSSSQTPLTAAEAGHRGPPKPITPQMGQRVMKNAGCFQCHKTDGTRSIGPALNGLIGRTATFTDGQIRVADEAYIRESVEEPSRHIVQGFTAAMPSYRGKLNERQMEAAMVYLRSISQRAVKSE